MICEDCYTLLHPRRAMMHLNQRQPSRLLSLALFYEGEEQHSMVLALDPLREVCEQFSKGEENAKTQTRKK